MAPKTAIDPRLDTANHPASAFPAADAAKQSLTSLNGLTMRGLNFQAQQLFETDTRNVLAYAVQRIHENQVKPETIAAAQITFGTILLMFHLYLQGKQLTTPELGRVTGHDRRTIRRHIKPLIELNLVSEVKQTQNTGKGTVWHYHFHNDLITAVIAMRPTNRR